MGTVEVEPDAQRDVQAATDWYEAQEPRVAARFRAAWEVCLELLAEAPERWPVRWVDRKSGRRLRRFVMSRFPYAVHYYVNDGTVVVVAFMHSKRRPNSWRKRLS